MKITLILLLIGAAIGVGFVMNRMMVVDYGNQDETTFIETEEESTDVTSDKSTEVEIETAEESVEVEATAEAEVETQTASQEAVAVPASSMTNGQRKMLETMGINPDEFVITDAMIVCAEGKLGAARVAEIQNGSTPSFMEGVSLFACYNQ